MGPITPIMISKFWPRTRKSHPLSKLLRPAFETKKIKEFLGVFLIAVVILSNFASHASAFEIFRNKELIAIKPEIRINTKKSIESPLRQFKLSQHYWFLHRAVDLAAPKGTKVHPIMKGVVEKIERGRFNYGNYLVINHGNQLKSLYAHLSKIEVKKGEQVEKKDVIGRVGSSGLATGNHLHLEIRKNGKYLNPEIFLR